MENTDYTENRASGSSVGTKQRRA
uniref:Uncharacterized protein n=1 Tax=Salix viminalis TaxID=40686 RepID=A0A6N2LLS8_SALVM